MQKKAIASLAGAFMLIGATPAFAQAPQSQMREDLKPGDRVEHRGLGVEVGPRGTWVIAHAIAADGDDAVLSVLTHPDGKVEVSDERADGAAALTGPDAAAADSPDACTDGAYNLSTMNWSGKDKSFKWKERFDWYYKANSTPAAVNVTEARSKITEATGNITASRNDCGIADTVTATHSRVGDTTAAADFTSGGTACKSYANKDNKNVVDWGPTDDNVLGVECTWAVWNGTDTYATAVQSDVRLSTDYNWYTTTVPVTCTDLTDALDTRYFSVEGVMTHERGHSFGVAHVDEATHGNLTMSSANNGACADAESSLGWGDIRALRALY